MNKKEKMGEIMKRLRKEYRDLPATALRFKTPFELLTATILSAQTTDVQVNKVTEVLFKKYRTPADYAHTPPERFAQDVKSVNFYRTKAKNIVGAAKMILERFNGAVPKTMDELITLPGVARKTANIVLHSAYGMNEGIAVDTHVKRLAYRLGLTKHEDPVKIEADLVALAPRKDWGDLSHLLIYHGRAVCQARKAAHEKCVLIDLCPSKNI